MKELTKRELTVLEIIWRIEKGFVNDVIAEFDDPKPPYTTISSIIRILETKEYVGHTTYGKTYQYYPIVSRVSYKKNLLKDVISNFFDGSFENVVSFLTAQKELSKKEVGEIEDLIKDYKSKGNE